MDTGLWSVNPNKRQTHQQRGSNSFHRGTRKLPGWCFQGVRQWANGPDETFLVGPVHYSGAGGWVGGNPNEVIHPIRLFPETNSRFIHWIIEVFRKHPGLPWTKVTHKGESTTIAARDPMWSRYRAGNTKVTIWWFIHQKSFFIMMTSLRRQFAYKCIFGRMFNTVKLWIVLNETMFCEWV